MFEFLKGKKLTTIDKKKIAELLSTNPEALEAFEQAYAIGALDDEDISENFFEINSRQAASMMKKGQELDTEKLSDIKMRIVNELLNECAVWNFDGQKVSTNNNLGSPVEKPVTNEEIKMLPEDMRPQLTGNLMKVDINVPSYITILENYINFLNEKNPKKREIFSI